MRERENWIFIILITKIFLDIFIYIFLMCILVEFSQCFIQNKDYNCCWCYDGGSSSDEVQTMLLNLHDS